jgi:hypothetical protein
MSVLTRASGLVRNEGDPRVIRSGNSSLRGVDQLARALGWFSIVLGVTQLLAPRRYTRALGVPGKETLVRACGVREIGAGMLTLSTVRRAGLWSRVGGDALDIALLGAAIRGSRERENVALALALVVGITALDVLGAKTLTARHSSKRGNVADYGDRSGYPHGLERARAAGHLWAPGAVRPGAARDEPLPGSATVNAAVDRPAENAALQDPSPPIRHH